MSYPAVVPPEHPAMGGRVALAVVALMVLVSAMATAATMRPVPVTIDGVSRTVSAGTAVGDLGADKVFSAPSGDLLSVDGGIAKVGGGAPARVYWNGSVAPSSQRVYRGDVLVSARGESRTESVEVAVVPVPYRIEIRGSGPIAVATQQGVDGSRRVTRGAVSGIEMTSVMIVPPTDQIILRTALSPGSKLVALTFDDGPWPVSTEAILDILDSLDARATFFMLGGRIKAHPDLVRRIVADGHLAAAHGTSHRRFSALKPAQVRNEIVRGRELIRDVAGYDSPWLRPPYGAMDDEAWEAVRDTGARVVLWDVDSRDWKKRGAKKIARSVVKQVKPGSIVLLHDGGGDRSQTVEALPLIIRDLKERGYLFVTVQDLVEASQVMKGPAARAVLVGARASAHE